MNESVFLMQFMTVSSYTKLHLRCSTPNTAVELWYFINIAIDFPLIRKFTKGKHFSYCLCQALLVTLIKTKAIKTIIAIYCFGNLK